MEALVNKIIPFSSVDGPGNRTAVFLQGCNYDCKYCHNPETRTICNNCGVCVSTCPTGALQMVENEVVYHIEKCCNCDTCIKNCVNGSSPKIRKMTPESVFQEIKKQLPYIRGITISGGECTLYPAFMEELFCLCKEENLGTLLDSNGSLCFDDYKDLMKVTDGVMLDIKAFTAEEHKNVVGVDNTIVLKNACELAEKGKLYEVRTVIVPELYDTESTVRNTAHMLAPYLKKSDIRYKLITYRQQGVREKYAHYQSPTKYDMEKLAEIAKNEGFRTVIIC